MTSERELSIAGVEREVVMLCAEAANREKVPVSRWVSARLKAAADNALDPAFKPSEGDLLGQAGEYVDAQECRIVDSGGDLGGYSGQQMVEAFIAGASVREADVGRLFAALKHGDQDHQDWLREAIKAHFAGKPVPAPRGQGNKEKRIAELEADVGRLSWQPIATAPQAMHFIAAKFSHDFGEWLLKIVMRGEAMLLGFTHWQPLPELPSDTQRVSEGDGV